MSTLEILIASHLLSSLVIFKCYAVVTECLYLKPRLENILLALLASFIPVINIMWIFVFLFQTLKREDV